jgi:hypothetical protein
MKKSIFRNITIILGFLVLVSTGFSIANNNCESDYDYDSSYKNKKYKKHHYNHDKNDCDDDSENIIIYNNSKSWNISYSSITFDDFRVKLDDDEVLIYPEYANNKHLRITDEYDLYVNDEKIDINIEQREFLEKYHKLITKIYDDAMDIGIEGAKIGVKGAAIGTKAISGVLKMMFTSYDSDDLERDIEYEAELLEEEAEELEEIAEELEDRSDEIEKYYYSLKKVIPLLKKYRWI